MFKWQPGGSDRLRVESSVCSGRFARTTHGISVVFMMIFNCRGSIGEGTVRGVFLPDFSVLF